MTVESVTYEEPADDEPSIFDIVDPEHDARVEADADIAAGRLILNKEVIAWLRTWETPGEQEPPAEWFK